jgi:hypothetical protein
MPNPENLQPFHPGPDSRRHPGRKPGSKNTSTIVKNLLETELSDIKSKKVRKLVEQYDSKNIKEAIIYAMVERSLNGGLKATEFLFKYLDAEMLLDNSVFSAGSIEIHVVDPKKFKNENLKESK